MCCNLCCKSFHVVLDHVVKYVNACCTCVVFLLTLSCMPNDRLLVFMLGIMSSHLIHKYISLCLISDALGKILTAKVLFTSTNIASLESYRESDNPIVFSIVQIYDVCYGVRFHFNIRIFCFIFVLGNI